MKKLLLGFFAVWMLCVPVFAHPPITVYVDGERISFDQAPVIQNDRTLVPMRAIFEALDAEVFWDEPTQLVTAVQGKDVILFRIGDTGLYKNNKLIYTMPVPAQIINDRTLVPLRAVAESLGTGVSWDGINYVIDINSDGSSTTILPDGQPSAAEQNTQKEPKEGGFSAEIKAPDGTVVLMVELEADVLSGSSKGVKSINAAMAEETFVQGQGFLREYADRALAAYEAKGKSFEPYYYIGTYSLMREADGYASFFLAAASYDGKEKMTECCSYTYGLSNGTEKELEDLVTDSAEELEFLYEVSFQALIDAAPNVFYSDAKKRLEKNLDEVSFYLTESGIAFYLAPGIIAPQETGVVSFEIAYDF